MSSIYTSLDSDKNEIRVMTIHPARSESDEIHCKFVHCKLDNNPVYEALSYTWGGPAPDPGKYIILNSQRFPVFENLYAALLKLRHMLKPRTLWIDAICINQGKDEAALREKEKQLLLMKRVYEQAIQVVVWLGDTGIGERIAMQSLANSGVNFYLSAKTWMTERKFGIAKGVMNLGRMSQALTGEWDPHALEVGELAQLLDRKWWRRVWIVQEIVLAKKAVVMCGPDEAPWEAFEKRMRAGVWGILGQDENQTARFTEHGSVIAKYKFPDAEYYTLLALQEKWRSKAWNQTWYSLLYTFRRYEATDAKDRVYAFLGLMDGVQEPEIVPDYSSRASTVFAQVARSLIVAHKHLLILNLKREPVEQGQKTFEQSQVYSLLDQIRFLDPDGLVVDAEGATPRKGWVRLPYGWERRRDGSRFRFYNHLTGEWHDKSPLEGQPAAAPQHMHYWRNLPAGWTKTWDNVGNAKIVFDSNEPTSSQPTRSALEDLPSWVPDWTQWSSRDPEPFPSLFEQEPRYWASGKNRTVQFETDYDSDMQSLKLTGVAFDKIAHLAQPWCPELHLLPVDRLDNKILQSWEALARTPVANCPYGQPHIRYNAYWRTHIADYPGERRATEEDRNYFQTWANRDDWNSRTPDFSGTVKSTWQKHVETPNELEIMNNMCVHMVKMGYVEAYVNPFKNRKPMAEMRAKYKEMRKRIYSASIGRVMFVTERGYIGLGPWNAKEGDVVSVLLGGCTPFLLRKVVGKEDYTLVGEAYVYGIMGGELFSGEMGHARLRAFNIV